MAIQEAPKPSKAQKKLNSGKKLERKTTLMVAVKTLKKIF